MVFLHQFRIRTVKIHFVKQDRDRYSVRFASDEKPVYEGPLGIRPVQCHYQICTVYVGGYYMTLAGEVGGFSYHIVSPRKDGGDKGISGNVPLGSEVCQVFHSVSHGYGIGGLFSCQTHLSAYYGGYGSPFGEFRYNVVTSRVFDNSSYRFDILFHRCEDTNLCKMVIFVEKDFCKMITFQEIDTYISRGIDTLEIGDEPHGLYDPIKYIISIGGKRIRPKLCLLTYSLFSDKIDDSVLLPALGIEIFHEFTLIHDDIMDKADIRRGKETVHKKWNDNSAILSGDVMSIKAYHFICKAPAERLPSVLDLFTETATKVCEGQQYDMNYEEIPVITMDEYMNMIGLKTGVLLACSAKMGAVLAGGDPVIASSLYDYGYLLGIAFQITDDYLDSFGDPGLFGKKIGGDIVNNKKSWLNVACTGLSEGRHGEEWRRICAMGEERSNEKIAAAQALYTELGIKEMAEREIDRYFKMAIEKLEKSGLSAEQIGQLGLFAEKITFREK